MTPEEYLRVLSKQLNEFSPKEQASLIDEVKSHIESYEEDKQFSKGQVQRRESMMNELGSPEEMGKRLKMIYRPGRFIDYFLVVIPFLLYPFINLLIQNLMGLEYAARVEVVLYSLLILLGLRIQSDLVTLFWITKITTQIISMLFVGYAFYGITQTIFWVIFTVGLMFLFAQVVWKNRNDMLVVVYACLPLIICGYGIALLATQPPSSGSLFSLFDRVLLNIYLLSGSGNGGFIPYIGGVLAITLIFLPTNRDIRWVGIGFLGLIDAFSRTYLNLFDGLLPPWVYSFYIFIPLTIACAGWWLERYERKQISLAA